MEEGELKNLLQVYNSQLEEARVLNRQSWVLSYQCFETLQTQKIKSKLHALATIKIVAVCIGLTWVIFLGFLVYGNGLQNIYFTCSVVIIMFFSVAAIIVYIKHIVLLRQIDYSDNIIHTQRKLVSLQLSTIQIVRLTFLQTPFYTTFFWSQQWINSGSSFWLISFPITILFTAGSIWLFKNISVKNIGTKRSMWLMSGAEFNYIAKAKAFLDEIEAFQSDVLMPNKK